MTMWPSSTGGAGPCVTMRKSSAMHRCGAYPISGRQGCHRCASSANVTAAKGKLPQPETAQAKASSPRRCSDMASTRSPADRVATAAPHPIMRQLHKEKLPQPENCASQGLIWAEIEVGGPCNIICLPREGEAGTEKDGALPKCPLPSGIPAPGAGAPL